MAEKIRCADCEHAREQNRHWHCRKGHFEDRRMTTKSRSRADDTGYQTLRRKRVCPEFASMDAPRGGAG